MKAHVSQMVPTTNARQQIDTLLESITTLRGQNKQEEAVELAEQAHELILSVEAADQSLYIETILTVAIVHHESGHLDRAEVLYKEGISNSDQQEPLHANMLYSLGQLYFEKDEPDRAATCLTEFLDFEGGGQDVTLVGRAFLSLARLGVDRGDHEAAIAQYQQALNYLNPADIDALDALLELGSFLVSTGEILHAFAVYIRALCYIHPSQSDKALVIYRLAALFHAADYADEAESLYQLTLQQLSEEDPGYLVILDKLAILYVSHQRIPEAEAVMREALSIRKRKLGGDHPDVVIIMRSLAILLIVSEQGEEGFALLDDALHRQDEAIATAVSNVSMQDRLEILQNAEIDLGEIVSFAAKTAPESPQLVSSIMRRIRHRRSLGLGGLDFVFHALTRLQAQHLEVGEESLVEGGLEQRLAVQAHTATLHAISLFVPGLDGTLVDYARCEQVVEPSEAASASGWTPPCNVAFVSSGENGEDVRLVELGDGETIERTLWAYCLQAMDEVAGASTPESEGSMATSYFGLQRCQ